MDVHNISMEERKEAKKDNRTTLYDNIYKVYNMKQPYTRLCYVAKTKESDAKDEKESFKIVIGNIEEEVKSYFRDSQIFNYIIIFSSINYCTILIEVIF